MPLYEFSCPEHGLFDVFTRMSGSPSAAFCPRAGCGAQGTRHFSAPALVNVQRDWNEKANEQQRDAYTQARAQLTNIARAEAERSGGTPKPVKEESVQVAARQIADKRPKKSVVQRQVELQRKLTRKAKAGGS